MVLLCNVNKFNVQLALELALKVMCLGFIPQCVTLAVE